MTTRRHRQRGFTLVEVMVGLLITTIVSVALAGAFLVGYRTISTEANQISADQAVSNASLPMLRDFSSATTITTGTITPGSAPPLTITFGNPVTTIRYSIDAKNNLIRTVVGGAATVAARGMQRVVVAAPPVPPCYYTLTLTPSAAGAVAVTLNFSRRTGVQGCF